MNSFKQNTSPRVFVSLAAVVLRIGIYKGLEAIPNSFAFQTVPDEVSILCRR